MKNSFEERRVQRYKDMYPHGTKIKLNQMGDDPNPIPPGSIGTVIAVDDIGTVHCTFEGIGRSLGLIPGEDDFRKLTQEEIVAEQAKQHPLLWGYGFVDNEVELTSYEEVAKFIIKNGVEGDVKITDDLDRPFISTIGIYLDKVADPSYRDELLKVLVPMQKELLDDQMDESGEYEDAYESDQGMTM